MKCKTVMFSKIMDKTNKRKCLSALHALNKCYECRLYDITTEKPCESRRANKKYDLLMEEKKKLAKKYLEDMENIKQKIERL